MTAEQEAEGKSGQRKGEAGKSSEGQTPGGYRSEAAEEAQDTERQAEDRHVSEQRQAAG